MLRKLIIPLAAAAVIGVAAIPTDASAHGRHGWHGHKHGHWHGHRYAHHGWYHRHGWHHGWHRGWRHGSFSGWYVPAWHGWHWNHRCYWN